MSSVLANIVDLAQLQCEPAMPNISLPPPTPPVGRDPPENDAESPSDSEGEDEEPGVQPRFGTQDCLNAVAAFTVTTARNLGLTPDGENSLLQFSQVILFPPFFFTLPHSHHSRTLSLTQHLL
jgi:hypothetical protein